MLSEAGHWACWFWGLLEGTLEQLHVRCCLWLALGNLFGATKWSTVYGCLWRAWVCVERTKLCTKAGLYQQWAQWQVSKSSKAPWDHLCLPTPARCLFGSVTESASVGTWVAWGRFSVSHQVGMSGVHQIYTGSNLVSLLDPRPLSKCPRVHQD